MRRDFRAVRRLNALLPAAPTGQRCLAPFKCFACTESGAQGMQPPAGAWSVPIPSKLDYPSPIENEKTLIGLACGA